LLVDAVDAEPVREQGAHLSIDFGRGRARIDLRAREHRPPRHVGREVALVADADHALTEAEGEAYLGRAGEQGDNARGREHHGPTVSIGNMRSPTPRPRHTHAAANQTSIVRLYAVSAMPRRGATKMAT